MEFARLFGLQAHSLPDFRLPDVEHPRGSAKIDMSPQELRAYADTRTGHWDLVKNLCLALADAMEERDRAVAHDRQPYPTAWAYEQCCKALETKRLRVEELERAPAAIRSRSVGGES